MGPVARLAARGAPVSLGADNVRDGFCAFGDFDPMAVLNLGAQVGHLHEPARDWARLITTNPARTMGLDWDGRIVAGAPADLVLFAARNSGEMNLRGVPERVVIRRGEWLKTGPPAFSELMEY
jgi:cytosine deaminase